MEYVVLRSGGKQYRVSNGDIFFVDKLSVLDGKLVNFEEILLHVLDSKVRIGTPTVKNVSVKAKVLKQTKGEKIRVSKFKSKVRYRRVIGFRSLLSQVQIQKIDIV